MRRLNSKLLDLFPDKKAKVFMKPDGEELVLIDAGEEDGLVRFGSSGATRNYILVNTLKKLKKVFLYITLESGMRKNVYGLGNIQVRIQTEQTKRKRYYRGRNK